MISSLLLLVLTMSVTLHFHIAGAATYNAILSQHYTEVTSPQVTLQNGTDNVSSVYTNDTSARISIGANTSLLTYNYSLNIISNNSACEVKLEYYSCAGLEHVNTTITLHDNSSSSEQITISGGNISQTNEYCTLASNATIYIGVSNLIENSQGTTTLNAYLRMKTPNTTTYTLYVITFEFT